MLLEGLFWDCSLAQESAAVNLILRTALIFMLLSVDVAVAVDITTAGVNNTRQGWNKNETALVPANVPHLKKIREFAVDEKVDVTPLVVGSKLYVFTMAGTAYIFDVNSGAQVAQRQLAIPFDPFAQPGQMDMWHVYHSWAISSTPVIDPATQTLYVATFGRPSNASPNTDRNNMLWVLDANTLADKAAPVLIAGDADNGGGGIANGSTTPYQKMRAGLGLLAGRSWEQSGHRVFLDERRKSTGPRARFRGGVRRTRAGACRRVFSRHPPSGIRPPAAGAGGIWMSGSAPAIDDDDIFLATGNGMDPGTTAGNFGESFVKLRYAAGAAGVNGGKPSLTVADYWGAFSDFNRQSGDQDLGSAGVFIIPQRGNLIGGGKDGILYNLNKDDLGKNSWTPQFNLPFVATYLPNAPNGGTGLPTSTAADPNWPIVNRDRNLPMNTPAGKSVHIHGTPVYLEGATGGIIYIWGENERLKAYNYDFATKRVASFRAQGREFASGTGPKGGMPGGRLVVSSNETTPHSAVVWGVYPVQGDANTAVVHGALVAYDAMKATNGALTELFHSDTNPANSLGMFAKFATPVVANGKVFVATFSNTVVEYGL
jgi:hypothetical protein